MYNKFHEMNENRIQALKYIEQCQGGNDGICTIKQYVEILLDSDYVVISKKRENYDLYEKLTANNMFNNENNVVSYVYGNTFDDKVKHREFAKFLTHKDGKKVNGNGFISEYTKPFKLKDGTIEQLKNYNPWWLK